jgi:ASCH domain.
MKALTIRQPWAELIVSGRRAFEVRNWKPDYSGWILVHAGKKFDEEAASRLNLSAAELTFGAIIGKVHIDDCIEFTQESWENLRPQHLEWADFQPGTFGWHLSHAIKFERPIPWSGSLGLFEVPDAAVGLAS